MQDAINTLKQQHQNISKLMEQLQSQSTDGERAQKMCDQLKEALEIHTAWEERHLYPVCEKHEQTKMIVAESYEEHKGVRNILTDLGKRTIGSQDWQGILKTLQDSVMHHVQEEEDELLPLCEKVFTQEERSRIDDAASQLKENFQERVGAVR